MKITLKKLDIITVSHKLVSMISDKEIDEMCFKKVRFSRSPYKKTKSKRKYPSKSKRGKMRKKALKKFPHFCFNCGEKLKTGDITFDHIKPIMAGGGKELSNLQPLCWDCNHKKGYSLPEKYEIDRVKRFLTTGELYTDLTL